MLHRLDKSLTATLDAQAAARIAAGIEDNPDGCWRWTRATNTHGYAQTTVNSRPRLVHRLTYETFVGPVPDGLVLDHLCRNRACVNPAHLEAVTQRENTVRGIGPAAINAAKTHCVNGHPLSGDNLRVEEGGKRRTCVQCRRAQCRRWRAAQKAKVAA